MRNRTWTPLAGYDGGPLTYCCGFPLYLTTLLVVLHVVAMLVTAGVLGFGTPVDNRWWHDLLSFSSNFWVLGHYWTPLTYAFYHNIVSEHIFFAVEMVLFFWFGIEVERAMGRRSFALLYAVLVVVPPLLLTALRPLFGIVFLSGSSLLHFGLFIAFVVLYPGVQFFGLLAARWLVWLFLFISSVFIMAVRDWAQLLHLWLVALLVVLLVRGWHIGFVSRLGKVQSQQKTNPLPSPGNKRAPSHQTELNVDAVLDKISRSGMASLNAEERGVLERASRKLAQQEKGRHR